MLWSLKFLVFAPRKNTTKIFSVTFPTPRRAALAESQRTKNLTTSKMTSIHVSRPPVSIGRVTVDKWPAEDPFRVASTSKLCKKRTSSAPNVKRRKTSKIQRVMN